MRGDPNMQRLNPVRVGEDVVEIGKERYLAEQIHE